LWHQFGDLLDETAGFGCEEALPTWFHKSESENVKKTDRAYPAHDPRKFWFFWLPVYFLLPETEAPNHRFTGCRGEGCSGNRAGLFPHQFIRWLLG
jgi:hypothetical protein